MMRSCRLFVAGVAVLLLAAAVSAQFMGRGPSMRGVWSPVVGSGSAYLMESKKDKTEVEYAIVGTEMFQGKPGHWLEMTMKGKEGEMVSKILMVVDGQNLQFARMVMQVPGEEPMEMPMNMSMGMMGGGERQPQHTDIRLDAVKVGTETVTTPGGTFTCEHYRTKDGADVWFTEKVVPYGLVKMTSKDSNMTLIRVISNAKTKIRGTPRKFDPAGMMRERP